MKKMYSVNGVEFKSFTLATKEAITSSSDVIEVETGIRRWSPAQKISAKKIRKYNEHKAAYDAQQSI